MDRKLTRRSFLTLGATLTGVIFTHKLLLQQTAQANTSNISIQSGDVTASSAIIWARGESDTRLVGDYSVVLNK